MATFRTDPNTGRTVISEENRVDRSGLSGRRGSTVQSRTSGGPNQSDGPTGGFGPPVGFDFGTGTAAGTLDPQEFMNVTGRTATNPYGKQGFFSRVFGFDPSKIDYTNNFGRNRGESQGIIATLNNRAYNAYLNPVDLSTGFVNPMLDEGSLTRFGPVERDPNLRQGIGGFGLPAVISNLFDRSGLVVPGQPASDARRQDIGIFDFETPRNMDELVSSALQEQAPRSIAGLTDIEIFEPFTTDEERMTEDAVRYETVSQFPPSTGFTRPDDAAMPTVAEILAAEPTAATAPVAGSVLVNPRPTVTTPETANERLMRERQETFNESLRRRAEETQGFGERMKTFAEEEAARMERIDALLGDPSDERSQPAPAFPQVDLTSLISPEFPVPSPVTPPRGIDPRALSLAQELQRLARERAMQ